MKLVLDDDQQLLAKTAAELVSRDDALKRLRRLRDEKNENGYSKEVYAKMAELGWTAIPFSTDQGGAGLGVAEMAVVLEALGRALTPEPLLSSVMLGGRSLALGRFSESSWLDGVIDGSKRVCLAYQEPGSRFDAHHVETSAEKTTNGYRITGEKVHVLDGSGADAYIVSARSSGDTAAAAGIDLFVVPTRVGGVEVAVQRRVDARNAAILRLERVELPATARLGASGEGAALLDSVIDGATAALCAEMLGSMSEAFDRTVEYMKERVQFGVPIGSFQALKHRAARVFVEIELARSAVMAAARALDAGDDRARALVSVAKAKCSEAFLLTANEAVQIHGGIGMTDEHDIGFFLKRARGAEMTFGDAAFHRQRFAALSGY